MDYRFLIDTAIDLIQRRYTNTSPPVSGDTVCVIYAGNGRIYTGVNTYVVQGNIPGNIHAEIEAINKMRADGETKIVAITVFNSCNISPIIPCNGCINLMLSLNYENTNTVVVTHNGSVSIMNFGTGPAGQPNNNMNMAGNMPMNNDINMMNTAGNMPINNDVNMNTAGNMPINNNNMTMSGNIPANNNYSVYHVVPEINRGASLYIPPNNPNEGTSYMNNMNSQVLNAYTTPVNNPANAPVNNSVTLATPPKRTGGSSILKNKLNNLLGND